MPRTEKSKFTITDDRIEYEDPQTKQKHRYEWSVGGKAFHRINVCALFFLLFCSSSSSSFSPPFLYSSAKKSPILTDDLHVCTSHCACALVLVVNL